MDKPKGEAVDWFEDPPGPSNGRARKRRWQGDKEDRESIRALTAKIRRLEADNDKVKSERDFYQSRSHFLQPASKVPPRIHTHSIHFDRKTFDRLYKSQPWRVDGIEMSVRIRTEADPRKKLNPCGWMHIELTPFISMTDAGPPRLVVFTVHVDHRPRGEKERNGGCKNNKLNSFGMTARIFLDKQMCFEGAPKIVVPSDVLADVKIRLSAMVERVEMPCAVGDAETTVVKVKDKEFHVNAAYLSKWSLHFRKIFAKTGLKAATCPAFRDARISAEDFAEMLLVIYPSQKPVSPDNYAVLLMIARMLEMPALTHLVDRFLMDLSVHSINKGALYRMAADQYNLPLVQAALLHRWQDGALLKSELISSNAYKRLKPATRNHINQQYANAFLHTETSQTSASIRACQHGCQTAHIHRGSNLVAHRSYSPTYTDHDADSPLYSPDFSDDDDNGA